MSKLEDYLMKEYPYKIEKLLIEDGGGYFITYLDLPGCMSDGDTLEEAIRMGEDARISWIENAIDIGKDIPEPNSHMDKELIDEAKEEGISLNQYMIYLIAKGMKVKESNSDNL